MVHRPLSAFLDELSQKQLYLNSCAKRETIISDVFYVIKILPDAKFARKNLENDICEALNQKFSKEIAIAYKLLIFNGNSKSEDANAIALLQRHVKRVASDTRNKKYHILSCSNVNVRRILELRYAEEALSLFGYHREKQNTHFAYVADESILSKSVAQMQSFAKALDEHNDENFTLRLDRSLSLVDSETSSREHFYRSYLPPSFCNFRTPSQSQHIMETSIERLREERKHADPQLSKIEFPFSIVRIEMPDLQRWQGVFYVDDEIEVIVQELAKVAGIEANRISLQSKIGDKLKRSSTLKKIGAIPGAYFVALCSSIGATK